MSATGPMGLTCSQRDANIVCGGCLATGGAIIGATASALTGVTILTGVIFGVVYHLIDNLSFLLPGHPLEFSKIVRVAVAVLAAFAIALSVATLAEFEITLASYAIMAFIVVALSNLAGLANP